MAEALTNYYFAKDLITNIQDKYKVLGNITDAKIFLYSNFFDIGYYYRLSSFFKRDPYKLNKTIHDGKMKDMIEEAIIYTRENGFDKDNVCFIYAMVAHYVLDMYTLPFIVSFPSDSPQKLMREIDYMLAYQKENIELGKISIVKKFRGAFLFNFSDFDLIAAMCSKNLYVSRSYEYYKTALQCYKHFLLYTSKDFLNIKSFFYKLNDKTFNKNNDLKTAYFIYPKKFDYTIDYLNLKNETWHNKITNEDNTKSFMDLYNEALIAGNDYMQASLDYLFLGKDKNFHKLFIK